MLVIKNNAEETAYRLQLLFLRKKMEQNRKGGQK